MFKRFIYTIMFTITFIALSASTVYASYSIDTSKVATNGTVEVKGTPGAKTIMVTVEKEGSTKRYQYVLSKTNSNVYPLQMGTGTYTIMVLENVAGSEYKPLLNEKVKLATEIKDATLYTNSIQLVDYTSSKTAITELDKIIADATTEQEKIDVLYDYIITNFDYDHAKAAAPPANYMPVLDTVYSAKVGICYDYSSLLAGSLRKNGIPVKLQMGYCASVPVYHAWNEIYLGGSWFVVDATYDAQVVRANLTVTMKKAATDYAQIVNSY